MIDIIYQPESAPHSIALTGSLTIYETREAHRALLEVLGDHATGDWQLDLQGLEELDSAGAQLLLGAARHIRQGGGALRALNPSASVLELLQLLRLDTLYLDTTTAGASSGDQNA